MERSLVQPSILQALGYMATVILFQLECIEGGEEGGVAIWVVQYRRGLHQYELVEHESLMSLLSNIFFFFIKGRGGCSYLEALSRGCFLGKVFLQLEVSLKVRPAPWCGRG